ncbi:hypothetical protein NFI96_001329 [Prochilodus magdalenae]|nr:hypothetical protein NFI96_001329 [Prochilodus magdalenae]
MKRIPRAALEHEGKIRRGPGRDEKMTREGEQRALMWFLVSAWRFKHEEEVCPLSWGSGLSRRVTWSEQEVVVFGWDAGLRWAGGGEGRGSEGRAGSAVSGWLELMGYGCLKTGRRREFALAGSRGGRGASISQSGIYIPGRREERNEAEGHVQCSALMSRSVSAERERQAWVWGRPVCDSYSPHICISGSKPVRERAAGSRFPDPFKPFIIFSNRHEIRRIDLHKGEFSVLVPGLRNTIALDFHLNESSLYWTDVVEDKIYRGKLSENGAALTSFDVVIQYGLATPEGLAVDWIAGNIYWVESNLDQIEVAKLDGTMRTTLLAGDVEHPRAIALDPREGILFWTDWDASMPRIEAASMSGEGRRTIHKETGNGGWPNGLTVDYLERRILWIDARSDAIYSAKYDGSGLIEVLRGHEYLSHPFAVTMYGGEVYWTDWRTNTLAKANKWTGNNVTVVQRTNTQPFDLQVYHPSRQPQAMFSISGHAFPEESRRLLQPRPRMNSLVSEEPGVCGPLEDVRE